MNFAELLKSVTWPDVKAALFWSYPDVAEFLEDYRLALAKLKQLQPVASSMRIIVKKPYRPGFDEEPFIEVIGRNGQLNREQVDFQYFQDKDDYANAETDFSISFHRREEWLGMEIDAASLDHFTASQITAHCIWDMTFHGFEQSEVQETLDEIKRRYDEIKSMTDEEKEKRLIPADEVMKNLRSKFE